MESFLETILKLTIETTLSSSLNYMFKHQIMLAIIYCQVAISIKVGAGGALHNGPNLTKKCCNMKINKNVYCA